MRLFAFLLAILLSSRLLAQPPLFGSDWTPGEVLLGTGDTLSGTLRFDLDNNLAQVLLPDNAVKTYAARQLRWLRARDPETHAWRWYYPIPYALRNGYKVPVFFEMLAEGTVSLLGRERVISSQGPYINGSFVSYRLVCDFFLGFANGRIRPFNGTRRDLERLLPDPSGRLREFVAKAGLRYDNREDLIRIVNQYNYVNNR